MNCHGGGHGGHKKKDSQHGPSHADHNGHTSHGHDHHRSGHSHGGSHTILMVIAIGIALAYVFLK